MLTKKKALDVTTIKPPRLLPRLKIRQAMTIRTLGRQFTALAVASVILTAGALLSSFFVLSAIRTSFEEIVTNSAPSVISAQRLGQAIQGADARAVDYQLFTRLKKPILGFELEKTRDDTWLQFLAYRQEVNDALFVIRSNILDVEEADTIKLIGSRFLDYIGTITTMKYEVDQGNQDAAIELYKKAQDILVGNLNGVKLDEFYRSPEEQAKLDNWPNFDSHQQYLGIEANIRKLSELNKTKLQVSSAKASQTLTITIFLLIILGSSLEIIRFYLCARYALITHRLINVGYILAFIGGVGVVVFMWLALLSANQAYKTLTVDSFKRLEAITKIRQLAADANADRSRLLLSAQTANVNSEVRAAFDVTILEDSFFRKQILLNQQLDATWRSITYVQEQPALCKIARNPQNKTICDEDGYTLDKYLAMDREIRTQFQLGDIYNAVKSNVTVSHDLYLKFDRAMEELSFINEEQFDTSACNAIGRSQFGRKCDNPGYLAVFRVAVWIIFPLIMLSTMAGYWFVRRMF